MFGAASPGSQHLISFCSLQKLCFSNFCFLCALLLAGSDIIILNVWIKYIDIFKHLFSNVNKCAIQKCYSTSNNIIDLHLYFSYINHPKNPLLQIAVFFPDHNDVTYKGESCFNLCCNRTKIKRISCCSYCHEMALLIYGIFFLTVFMWKQKPATSCKTYPWIRICNHVENNIHLKILGFGCLHVTCTLKNKKNSKLQPQSHSKCGFFLLFWHFFVSNRIN